MPIDVESKDLRPTFIANPDTRFAASFLDIKYRKYAVVGEAMMDKTTGELYFKRKGKSEDDPGKVLSFSQDYRDLYDQAWQFKVITASHTNFTPPVKMSDAYLISTNYDLACINNEIPVFADTLTDGKLSITNYTDADSADADVVDIDSRKTLSFKCTKGSMGFIIKLSTRASDKLPVEFLTKEYNRTDSSTSDAQFNAIIKYTVVVDGVNSDDEDKSVSLQLSSKIRVNEPNVVDFSDDATLSNAIIANKLQLSDYSVSVYIDEIQPYKITGMLSKLESDNTNKEIFSKISNPDEKICFTTANITHYVSSASDIIDLGNETHVAAADVSTFTRLMAEMNSLRTAPSLIVSVNQPSIAEWTSGVIWAQKITTIDTATGIENRTLADIDVDYLASRINPSSLGYGRLSSESTDKSDKSVIYIEKEE